MKKLLILFVCVMSLNVNSQELNCQVNVIADAKLEITSVELEIFEALKQTIFDMMNSTQWTKDKFSIEERINCNISLQIKQIINQNTYICNMQVQSTRPAYNSSYNTTLFNFNDEDVAFGFKRNSTIIYAPNQFRDNLTSILAFYAYLMIGLDYDSYSPRGGSKYFQEAQNIVSMAQSAPGNGWKSNEAGKRNRYWLVDNIMRPLFEPLRDCSYEYHRKGIDLLYDDLPGARKNIYNSLTKLNRIVAMSPNSVNLQNFSRCKTTELVNLYEDAEVKEKNDLVTLMKRIDPTNSSKYEEILK
jgi:hypothetical protein